MHLSEFYVFFLKNFPIALKKSPLTSKQKTSTLRAGNVAVVSTASVSYWSGSKSTVIFREIPFDWIGYEICQVGHWAESILGGNGSSAPQIDLMDNRRTDQLIISSTVVMLSGQWVIRKLCSSHLKTSAVGVNCLPFSLSAHVSC